MKRILAAILGALARPLVSVAVIGLILVAAVLWLAGWLPFGGGGIGTGRGTDGPGGDGGTTERKVEAKKPSDPAPKPGDPEPKATFAKGIVETPNSVEIIVVVPADTIQFEGKPITLAALGEMIKKLRQGRTDGKTFQVKVEVLPTTRIKPVEDIEDACKTWGVQYLGPRATD